MPRITKAVVDSIKPPEKGYSLSWDSEIPSFGLRTMASGIQTYVLQYRNKYGRSRRYSIGRHGTWTADKARREARRLLGLVDKGEDPIEDRKTDKSQPTVNELSERYLAEHATPRKKPTSLYEDQRLLQKNILPTLGKKLVEEITSRDVSKLHNSLRGKPYLANRVISLLATMMNLAVRWKLRSDNPCQGIEKFKEHNRKRFLSEVELERLGATLVEIENLAPHLQPIVNALRLLLLTGCRRNEILSLRWEYIDFDRGFIQFPDTKSGEKIIPLNAPVIELLANIERKGPWVIPGKNEGEHRVNINKAWLKIREQAGLPGIRIHDLRHTFGSVGASSGIGLSFIGKLLGHSRHVTTQRYAHLADNPVKEASEAVGRKISESLSKVVSLKKAK
jgi:integrase